MEDLKILRKNTVANATERFVLGIKGTEYLVKNFNDFDIYVSFIETTDTSKMIKIPAQSSQVCLINKTAGNYSEDVWIYAGSVGEVEVQCLKF